MGKQVIDYIRQPENLDSQALEHLRTVVDRDPYYHAARLLLLRTLYQMHDPAFNEHLHKAAVFMPSRQTLFQMFQAPSTKPESPAARSPRHKPEEEGEDSTVTLINSFLDTLPEPRVSTSPRIVDATVDYMSYLLQMESTPSAPEMPKMVGQDYIDNFLINRDGHFDLDDSPTGEPTPSPLENSPEATASGILTEAMARIYIKQGKYDKAIEIIRRISLKYPKKNRYFADQIRFLEKLIINQQS